MLVLIGLVVEMAVRKIEMGIIPPDLTIHLVANSVFSVVLTTDQVTWADVPVLVFQTGSGEVTWHSTVSNANATFYETQSSVNALIGSNPVRARLVVGGIIYADSGRNGVVIHT